MYVKKNTRVTDNYKKLVLGFVIITVMLVGIIFYFSASKAIVKITPQITPVETDFVADVVTDGGQIDQALQGVLFETEVEGSVGGDATGTQLLEGGVIGTVTLINNRPEAQTLVKTTRLLTEDGILLRLSERVDIPANGEVEASVYADDPNSFTEILPTRLTIPGLWEGLQSVIYAENKSAITSTGESVRVLKAVDIARTKDKLTEELYNKAIQEFTSQLPNDNYTTIVVAKNLLSESVSEEVDSVIDTFTASMKLRVVLIALNQDEIIELAGDRLKSVVSSSQELLNIDMSKFSYTVQNYDDTTKTSNVKVHVEGDAVIRSDHEIFDKSKLVGLSPKGLELYLANFDEVENVEVELSPFWVKKVPRLEDHVIITVINPNK